MSVTRARRAGTATVDAKTPRQKPDSARKQEQVRIMAARLRMTTDKRLNKETPGWVEALAKKPL